MKRAAHLILFCLSCACLPAQTPGSPDQQDQPDQRIASHQPEVELLAQTLFATRLDSPAWSRHDLGHCEAFRHHAFAIFERTPHQGIADRFVAFYDLDRPPAHSATRPWEGGVLLLRLRRSQGGQGTSSQVDGSLISAFNRTIKREEDLRVRDHQTEISSLEIADCFIAVTGEEAAPAVSSREATSQAASQPLHLSSVLIPLTSSSADRRTEHLQFDGQQIADADVIVQHLP